MPHRDIGTIFWGQEGLSLSLAPLIDPILLTSSYEPPASFVASPVKQACGEEASLRETSRWKIHHRIGVRLAPGNDYLRDMLLLLDCHTAYRINGSWPSKPCDVTQTSQSCRLCEFVEFRKSVHLLRPAVAASKPSRTIASTTPGMIISFRKRSSWSNSRARSVGPGYLFMY